MEKKHLTYIETDHSVIKDGYLYNVLVNLQDFIAGDFIEK
ncbi:MAG: hypothetical protein ACI86M_002001 [Saprospiraceae bacterium]|jgi:hypothetical protein